jgi:hypothetical protein
MQNKFAQEKYYTYLCTINNLIKNNKMENELKKIKTETIWTCPDNYYLSQLDDTYIIEKSEKAIIKNNINLNHGLDDKNPTQELYVQIGEYTYHFDNFYDASTGKISQEISRCLTGRIDEEEQTYEIIFKNEVAVIE